MVTIYRILTIVKVFVLCFLLFYLLSFIFESCHLSNTLASSLASEALYVSCTTGAEAFLRLLSHEILPKICTSSVSQAQKEKRRPLRS